jgi:hypothetical protein
MSLALPALNGLIVRTGRVGHSCPAAAELMTHKTTPAIAPRSV